MASPENPLLSKQLDLLDQILAASTDQIYIYDRAGRHLYASPAGLAALGLEAQEVLGRSWRELNFPAEVMERHDRQRESVFQTGIPVKGETRFPTLQGIRYYEYVISPVLGAAGEIEAVINTGRDITERQQAENALRQLTEELEARVLARTEELTALNESLQVEIAERQKAEQALQESQMRFHALVDAMFEGIVVQENGKIIEANPGFANMFGYSLDEVIGKSAVDFLTPESLETVMGHIQNEYELPYEMTGIKKDGTLINLEVVGKQSLYQGRRVRVSAARDITERKRAEIALREKEQQLQQLSDSMPQFVWISNAQGETEYVNRQWLEYSGLTLEQSCDLQKVAEFHHPEEVQSVLEQWAIARATQQPFEMEARLKRASDGAYRWFLIRSVPALDQQGQVVRWYGTSTDIHDRKVAQLNEQFLSDLDRRLRQLTDSQAMEWEVVSSLGEYLQVDRCLWHTVDLEAGMTTVGQDWYRQLDLKSTTGVYRLSEYILPEMIRHYRTGQPLVIEDVTTHVYTESVAHNFAQHKIRAILGIPWIESGHWVAALAVNSCTTRTWRSDEVRLLQEIVARLWSLIEQKRAVKVLQEQEERTRLATEAADLGMWFWNLTQNELVWTDRCKALFGLPADGQISYEVFLQTLHPDDRDFTHAAVNQALEQRTEYNIEYRIVWPDGSIHWISAKGRGFYDADGQPIRMMGTAQDISDRKQAEAERKLAEIVLQEREALLHLFAQYAPAGIAMFDREMRYVMTSQRWADDYYYGSLESLVGRSHYELFPEMPERWRQIHQRCLAGAIEQCDEDLFVRADGKQQWIRWEVRPWYSATDEIGGIIIFAEDITQRKQAEAAVLQLNLELQQKVTELQTLLDVIPIGIGIAEDPAGQHIRINPAFAEVLGIPPTVNASLSAPEEERPTNFKVYQNGRELAPEELPLQYTATHGVEIRDLEVEVVWQDGTTVTLLEYAAPLFDQSGQTRGSVGAFLNITERKRAEQNLRDNEQQLKLALQAAKAGAWSWELATNCLYWSDEYYRVFGLEPGSIEPSYENGFSRLHPDDREWVERETTEAIAQGKNTNLEYRILLPDGTFRWVVGIGQMFFDEWQQPVRMAGIVVDITERKQVEAELRKKEELYRALAHNFPNGAVHIFDHDLRYLLSDGTEMRKVGLSQEQLEGHLLWEVVPSETSTVLEPLYQAALSGETTISELAFAGQIYQIYTLPLRDQQGEIFAGLSMSQNVTLLKQAEQTLRTARDELEQQVQERTRELQEANALLQQREREFRTLVENTPDVITRHDRQYRCLYINPASTQSLGMPPEFFIGKKPSELGYPDDLVHFWENSLENVFATGQMQIDEFNVTNGDEIQSYQVCVVPELELVPEQENDRTIISVMTIGRDVTRLKQAEEAAQKLAEELKRSNQELEQFAYVASHDLQEPLRAITSFTQLLAKRYRGQLDAKAETYIEFIVDGATRMQQLIKDLLTYSRAGRYELKLQPVDCQTLLDQVKKDLQVVITETQATLTADPLPTIIADPTQFKNLLQNLISNSLKYRSEISPKIHVSARKVFLRSENEFIAAPSSLSLPGTHEEWLFSVQDNGIGIEPQYAERIFGIFQRLHTSDEYSGTGLGLAICRKIIERHHGRIWVESQLGQGATFFFTIPISMRSQDDIPRQITQDSPGGRF
uniref:histidine kinase n=1 Tax=Cyanothece sp. (strain PCC 7425 / ATCC 29141) TaxID=395961 RepID=B8HLZ2_CYAP4